MLEVETKDIAAESSTMLAEAKVFKIADSRQYTEAGARLQGIKALSKKLDDTFDPHIKRAFDAHRALVAEKKTHQTPLQTTEALLKTAMLGYMQEEERKRREIEAKAQEEARKEREKLEARAAKAAAAGKTEKAEALQATAAAVMAPLIPVTTQKLAGISTRITYSATVTDLLELCKAIAAGTIPVNAVTANMPFLNNQARVMKETLAYPGVKVVAETGLASRSA